MPNTYASALQKLKELDFTPEEILDILATIGQSALIKTFQEINNQGDEEKSKEFYLAYDRNLQKLVEDTLN